MPKDTGILGQGGGIAEINAVVRPNDAVFAVLFIQALGLIIGVAPVGAFQNRIVIADSKLDLYTEICLKTVVFGFICVYRFFCTKKDPDGRAVHADLQNP
jgi:hypothetical protein